MRTLLFAEATLIRYGACTYSGMLDAFSTSASSRGLGFFQLCGLPRKNCTTSAPSASAAARGSSWLTWDPISTGSSLVRRPDTAEPPGLSQMVRRAEPVVAIDADHRVGVRRTTVDVLDA